MNISAGTWLQPDEVNYNLSDLEDEFVDNVDEDKGVKVKVDFEFDPGENLEGAVELYGDNIVYTRWLRQVRRDGGNAVRSALSNGKHPSKVVSEMQEWRPDVSRRSGGGDKSLEEQFQELDPDEAEEKLQRLMEIAQGGDGNPEEPQPA